MINDGIYDVPAGKLTMAFTHLEMCEAPALPTIDIPDGLTFHPLERRIDVYRDLYTRIGQDWLWYYRLTLSAAELTAHFDNQDIEIFTLSKDGQPEAILELDFRPEEECELAYFGLTAPLIGKGAGSYLMSQALTLAWARPIKRLHLHTCNYDSPQALGFYIRNGFIPYKRAVEIDDDPRLTGVLPETAAPHVPLIRP